MSTPDGSQSTAPVTAKRSFNDGKVALNIALKVQGWGGGTSARINASTDLTTAQARALAEELAALADSADAAVARRDAKDARRKAWRDREIAAGRMVVIGALR